MKLNFNKKICALLITSFIIQSFVFYVPNKAHAQYPVIDAANLKVNILQSTLLGTIAKGTTAQDLKEYVLDGLAGMFAKQIIRQITSSIVNWINSGFNGSPSFVQNPGAFFLDMADQITGDFLFKTNSPLSQLCSPFSIDIRLALAFKYRPNVQKRYACTLGLIIKNTTNAVKNASINGFTAGDFRQGGWPAFVSLTTEPQNNIYGAYLQAESELSFRVAQAQLQQKEELNQGRGFLSWKKCTTNTVSKKPEGSLSQSELEALPEYDAGSQSVSGTEKTCEIQTPGSVIEGALQNSLGGPLRELELADEINEIVNALFAQLVTQVLSAGLGGSSGVSGQGTSDLNSYINKINSDVNNTNTQISDVKSKLIEQINNSLKQTEPYKANKDASLNLFINVKSKYEIAKSCYVGRIEQIQKNPYYYNNNNSSYQGSIPEYQSKIAEIDNIITTQITPTATTLLNGVKEADARLQTLNDLKASVNRASTLNDINGPSQKFAGMLQSGSLTSALDVQNSKDELDVTTAKVSQFNLDAQRKLQECQIGY